MNAIGKTGIKIATHNIGSVDSSALLPYLGGSTRYATPGASFWMHNVKWPGIASGMTKAKAIHLAERTEFEEARMAAIVADVTGMEIGTVRSLFNTDSNHSAESARQLGMVHEVGPLKLPEPYELVQLEL